MEISDGMVFGLMVLLGMSSIALISGVQEPMLLVIVTNAIGFIGVIAALKR